MTLCVETCCCGGVVIATSPKAVVGCENELSIEDVVQGSGRFKSVFCSLNCRVGLLYRPVTKLAVERAFCIGCRPE